MAENGLTPKELATKCARVALRSFLATGCALRCAPAAAPRVSVLMLLCNRAELTLAALQSLLHTCPDVPLELILVDNGSTDETGLLLERIEGAKVLRNARNVGYPCAVNQAARRASGEFLLLLNNDAQILGNSIGVAVSFLDAHPDVGAVGGRVVLLDGTLQEAGCTIAVDGWSIQLGRGRAPDDAEFTYQRDVDYCSGAFLLTRRALFEQLGGLDEVFSPGYFEDADYGMRLGGHGWRCVFHPDIAVLHYENGTSHTLQQLPDLLQRNHRIFAGKHSEALAARPELRYWSLMAARSWHDAARRVLIAVDGFRRDDSPSATAAATLTALVRRLLTLDTFLTLCYTPPLPEALAAVFRALPGTVEVLPCESRSAVARLLEARRSYYQLVIAGDAAAEPLALDLPADGPLQVIWSQGRLVRPNARAARIHPHQPAVPCLPAA